MAGADGREEEESLEVGLQVSAPPSHKQTVHVP